MDKQYSRAFRDQDDPESREEKTWIIYKQNGTKRNQSAIYQKQYNAASRIRLSTEREQALKAEAQDCRQDRGWQRLETRP